MRLRRLIASAVLLSVLPVTPAFADDPSAQRTPTAQPSPELPAGPEPTQDPPPADQPTQEKPTQEKPAPEKPAEEKLEDGLSLDGGPVRAIVELTGTAQTAPVAAEATKDSLDVVLQPQTQPFVVVQGTAEELAKLADDPRVTAIRRDRAYPPTLVSSLQQIGATEVHRQGHTGAGQTVAVLDTGIDRDHPVFQGRIVDEACFSAVDAGVRTLCPNGQATQTGLGAADAETASCQADGVNLCDHGTHVAGIAAGTGGVAPGAGIVAVQVFSRIDDEATCGQPSCILAYESSLRLAMEYVAGLTASRPIAAVNLSLGGWPTGTSCDTSEEGAAFKPKVDDLLAKGVATVVAAGNEGYDGASFPACVSSTLAVGANDDSDAIADFSNRGAMLDLFAPGVDIESAVPDDSSTTYSGTSMAAPHVAGALAVLKAQAPQAPITELIDKLRSSGRPYTYQGVTTPRLDLLAAVTGGAPQAPIEQNPGAPGDPDDPGHEDEPDPDPSSSGPSPEPVRPDPTPVPIPTVTVTVTVTAKAPAAVCTRGTAKDGLSAKQWAVEMHRRSGSLADSALNCYLKLAGKSSRVFPELTKATSLGKAYRVLKVTEGARAKLDRALLAGWLNWANGNGDLGALQKAEKVRLSGKSTAAQLVKAAASLR
ncbi:S8 family peptidase [Nonomuraea longicatena]|uniref:Peptidase S8/S53 domain-containing protein n=1 Tax=Nonomuraea longicatena TaxID=83682 RepID=A0ABN1P2A4_9ACTN